MTIKRHQSSSVANEIVDLSHTTKPRLEPLLQRSLESVGMTARKAFSDGRHKREMAQPKKLAAIECAIRSNLDAARLAPFSENKSATDPWAAFRLAAQGNSTPMHDRVKKRVREDAVVTKVPDEALISFENVSMPAEFDPNFEFTHPPWLSSQESIS